MRLALRTVLAASAAAAILATPLAAQPAPAPNRPFTATGTLQGCNPRAGDHAVRLTAGTRYTIRAASEDFDTILALYRTDSNEPVAQNDDADGSLNSRIGYTASETGTYCLRVTGYGGGAGGSYTVSAEVAPPAPPANATPTRTESTEWRVFDGELAGDGAPRDYALTLAEGQIAMISLESDAFDPVVEVRRADDPDGDAIEMDDDGGSGLNSFLVFSGEAGDYLVRVRAYSSSGEGAYTLKIGQ
ncbi:MAG: PPC domain-containing protein [Sphingomonas sp.]|nr:PPC domain-containing protein [Sphingomonas sp.]